MALPISNLSVSTNAISKYGPEIKNSLTPTSPQRSNSLRITEESSWNKQVAPKLTCIIIGVGAGFLGGGEVKLSAAATADGARAEEVVVAAAQRGRSVRWSDARRCPQWSPNSLETVVPENLPRPWNRRNYEVGIIEQSAPSLGGSMRGGSCFSL
ncbi:protein CHLOROPLAST VESICULATION [Nymphaea colorata]|nr:protein CHLOROPLAST VESICULATION [Nymphaea colorata]